MNKFRHPADFFDKKIILETDRLVMRKLETADTKDMYAYASREQTSRYLLWYPHNSEYATRGLLERLKRDYRDGTYYELALVYKENGKMIGTCGITSFDDVNLSVEIGYVLNPDYWGMGLAAEAASVMINFAFFEIGAHRVEARYMKGNENSRRVMEKCGMTFEGMAKGKLLVKGLFRDIGTCAITEDEYFSVQRESIYKKFNPPSFFGMRFR